MISTLCPRKYLYQCWKEKFRLAYGEHLIYMKDTVGYSNYEIFLPIQPHGSCAE